MREYIHQHQASVFWWLIYGQLRFWIAAILKFMMAAANEGANVIVIGLIEFLDPENIGLGTNIMSLWVSQTKIWSKVILMVAILKSALCSKIYTDLGLSPKFFWKVLVCTTIKSWVSLYFCDGHELPPRAYTIYTPFWKSRVPCERHRFVMSFKKGRPWCAGANHAMGKEKASWSPAFVGVNLWSPRIWNQKGGSWPDQVTRTFERFLSSS